VVEEIIGRLSDLTGAQIGRLEDELRRERRRRASTGGGEDAPHHHEGAACYGSPGVPPLRGRLSASSLLRL
jgi:hypothetical protein